MNTNRQHRWSWWSCFAVVKHNKKTKKQRNYSDNTRKSNTNGDTNKNKQLPPVNENNCKNEIPYLNESNSYIVPNSCIIKIDSPLDEIDSRLIDGDCLEQVTFDELNTSSLLKCTQLDAIVEDVNEENANDEIDELVEPVRLCCDRDIIGDSNSLHSRLSDLSHMNHVVTQFRENGNFLGEFIHQIEKLKMKTDDIARLTSQMPRDADLLEARYSTLLASIESLSLLLQIAQIPACRSLISRLISSIEQRSEQLKKLVQLASISITNSQLQRRDTNEDDLLSFRSALSSYEHLFTMTS